MKKMMAKSGLSIIVNKLNGSTSSQGESEGGSSSDMQEYLFIKGRTLREIVKKSQTYTDKSISGGHISYFLIGEEMAKKGLSEVAGFLTTEEEIRFSGRVYIIKNEKANEFLKDVINPARKLGEKLDSMEENIKYLSIVSEFRIIDLLELLSDEEKAALIPVLEKIELQVTSDGGEEANSSSVTEFDFAGYGIISNSKLVDYLNKEESWACNFVRNEVKETSIVVNNDEDNSKITVSAVEPKSSLKFKFEENVLKEINVDIKAVCNLEEISFNADIFKNDEVEKIEQTIENIVGREVEAVIKKSQDMKIDFMDIKENLKLKHPYKYQKIQDNWLDNFANADVNVSVDAQLERKYDLLKTQR